jgi:hypothetical protein
MSNRRIPPLSTDGEISIMNKYLVEIKKKNIPLNVMEEQYNKCAPSSRDQQIT